MAGRIKPALLLSPAFTDMELSLRRINPDWARLRLVWLRDGVQAPPRHGGFKDGRRSGEDSTGQDLSFLNGFLDEILSTEGDFERVLGLVEGVKADWGNEPASAMLVWGILDNSLVLLPKLLPEGDFGTVLCFVGDAILVWGTEPFSTILFLGTGNISVFDLLNLFSILSIDGDFVMGFGLDGSTTVDLGTEAPPSIFMWGGNSPIEYLFSFLSILSREGDFVIIFGLVGESAFLFNTE